MPTVISIIDVQSLELLDHVFTLFSFSFKYLLKPIRDDIENFYTIYQELLVHGNRHIRHFAAQSFSYILRKTKLSPELLKLILRPLRMEDCYSVVARNTLHGVSDALFEVMYGAS